MQNELIRASAGSGKTFQLTNRYLALLARDLLNNRDPHPERIIAITFTRKAAGEFFVEILKKLAAGSSSEDECRSIAGPPDDPLHATLSQLTPDHYRQLLALFIERMPRLFLGTLDSFFSSIVRTHPTEFGLSGDFDILDEHAATQARQLVYRQIFTSTQTPAEQEQFLEAYHFATFGKEDATVFSKLDTFITNNHSLFLSASTPDLWGNPARIWPDGSEWFPAPDGSNAEDARQLDQLLDDETLSPKQEEFWREFTTQLTTHNPGTPFPPRVEFFLKKLLPVFQDLKAGRATISVQKKQELSPALCQILTRITRRLLAGELNAKIVRTAGIQKVLANFESVYAHLIRRRGQLTFRDLEVLLAGSPDSPAPLLSQSPSDDTRLRIDYRLDSSYHHWLLDEFQDTSRTQWNILQPLIDETLADDSGDRSLYQVGDIKQAIYGWRGGDSRLFDDTISRYGENRIQQRPLDTSWRSGPDIIEPLNQIFSNQAALLQLGIPQTALDRFQWQTHTVAPKNQTYPGLTALYQPLPAEGSKPTLEDSFALTLALLKDIRPTEKNLSCALLVQKNDTAQALVEYIRTHSDLPVASEADVPVTLDNPVTLAFLSLFALAAHPHDSFALGHLRLSPLAPFLHPNLPEEVRLHIHYHGFEPTLLLWIQKCQDAELLDDPFSRQRLQHLLTACRQFDASGNRSLDSFLAFAQTYKLRETTSSASIQVMTIHKSKGLTFDMVILPELTGNKLTEARDGLAIQTSPPDQAISWILDPPVKAIREQDPVLQAHHQQAESDAAYEKLSLFYVALTRAKYANYLIAPDHSNSRSHNFVKLLESTLADDPAERTLGDLTFNSLFESSPQTNWWTQLSPSDPTPPPRTLPDLPANLTPRPRPGRRIPSQKASPTFSLAQQSALDLGTEVHQLLAQIDWLKERGAPAPQTNQDLLAQASPQALQHLHNLTQNPDTLTLLTKPDQPHKLWREQAFEVLLDDHWTSGIIDRAHILLDNNGTPTSAHLIDYKTDPHPTPKLIQTYTPQLKLYQKATAHILNLPPEKVQTTLLFTSIPQICHTEPKNTPNP
ncbi:MAG: UvrD-helicase domain-containing protein [Verrucomicrobiota bacterium]